MPPLLALLALAGCTPRPLTLAQAERLALAAPNIVAAVKTRGAVPFFEWVHAGPLGWGFTINSRTGCPSGRACSTLLGHYVVVRTSGTVWDLDAGMDGEQVTSKRLERLRRSLLRRRCQ